jgi:hypothetical protein
MDDNHSPETIALLHRLMGYWMQQGLRIRTGVSFQEIDSFESRYRVRLPADLRSYYVTIDGMEEGETDPNVFWFLPLKAVKSIPEELAHFGGIPDYRDITRSLADPHRWFVIVDYLITSAVYAIRLSATDESTPVLWISGSRHRIVAPSFSGFLEAYLENPLGLMFQATA